MSAPEKHAATTKPSAGGQTGAEEIQREEGTVGRTHQIRSSLVFKLCFKNGVIILHYLLSPINYYSLCAIYNNTMAALLTHNDLADPFVFSRLGKKPLGVSQTRFRMSCCEDSLSFSFV